MYETTFATIEVKKAKNSFNLIHLLPIAGVYSSNEDSVA
jgi:hypothetical protein